MTLGDAGIKLTKSSGTGAKGAFPLGKLQGLKQFLFLGLRSFDLFSSLLRPRFRLRLRFASRVLQATFGFFTGHRDFKLRVFGLCDLGFRVDNLVLQGFICFVGFNRAALVTIFLRAGLSLLDVRIRISCALAFCATEPSFTAATAARAT